MGSKSPLKVILLEDDESFSHVFKRVMERRNHEVLLASTVAEFKMLITHTQQCNLILMDLKLENQTSLSVINEARAAFPSARIFVITAFASIATTVEAIKLGADDYLPKPLTIDDILNAYQGKKSNLEAKDVVMTPKRLEWEYIQKILNENSGNITKTASILKMHRRTLQRKLNKKPEP